MEASLLHPGGPRFSREPRVHEELEVMAAVVERERQARIRAERVASDLARIVAAECRRADEAEAAASEMARLVAHENARANRAERALGLRRED